MWEAVLPFWMHRNFREYVRHHFNYLLCQKLDERFMAIKPDSGKKGGAKRPNQSKRVDDPALHAMVNPENTKNLMVRISGYNTCFVTLNKEIQIELIERAEYGL